MNKGGPTYLEVTAPRLMALSMLPGAVLAIMGSVVPWLKITGLGQPETLGGFENGGFGVIVLAAVSVVAIAGFMVNPERNRWMIAVTFVLGTLMIAEQGQVWVKAEDTEGYEVRVGIYLVLIGGANILVGSIVSFLTTEPAKRPAESSQPEASLPS